MSRFDESKPRKMELINHDQLKNVCPTIPIDRCDLLTALLNELGEKYGFTSKNMFHEFLANVAQESMEFNHKEENMWYRPETLMRVWPSRFPNLASTVGFARNPIALANKVYGGRMGNVPGTNDGANFKGGGFIGLTGREVYTKYANYINETPEKAAELVRTTDRYALDSAFWFFSVLKGLNDEAERDEFLGIVKSINGGFIGLDVRKKYYERAKKYVV